MKVIDFLRAKFLIENNPIKSWRFILFLVFLSFLSITSAHQANKKVYKIAKLKEEIKSVKSRYVKTKTELMELQLESKIAPKVSALGLKKQSSPPKLIVIQK